MDDPYNNIGRFCSVTGLPGYRVWHITEFVHDSGGNATYRVRNIESGAQMRASVDALTNLY
jgi:hypothetical protein